MTSQLIPDQQWFRSNDGLSLLAGSPLTAFTVTESGARILDAIEAGEPLPQNHRALTSRLLATGAVHPRIIDLAPVEEITAVIPAYIATPQSLDNLRKCVESLRGINIVIVDDASPLPIDFPLATILRRETNGGPSAARNAGVATVSTPYVIFVDSDAIVTSHDAQRLCSVFADNTVTLAAPRIRTENDKTFLGEYESLRSPLDLGSSPAVVRPLSRVSYVPATVLAGRTEDFQQKNSFDESMRLGEDVDLVWRVAELGGIVRYVPEVECLHAPRRSWGALLKQRFGYGSSAAALDSRHPRRASPLRANGVLLLPALALLAGFIYFAVLLALPTVLYFAITLRNTGMPLRTRSRIIWIGFTATVTLLAGAVRRAWWPIFVLCMAFLQPALFMMLFAVLAPAAWGIVRSKPRFPGGYFLMRILDDAAYGLGVWVGAFRARHFRCLMPVITLRRTSRTK